MRALSTCVIALPLLGSAAPSYAQTFSNPAVAGADPIVNRGPDGIYYLSTTYGATDRLYLWSSKTLSGMPRSSPRLVWTPPPNSQWSKEIWPWGVKYLNGNWYFYFAADDGNEYKHRMYVLKSTTQSPYGPYPSTPTQLIPTGVSCPGSTPAGCWGLAGAIIQNPLDNKLYYEWAGKVIGGASGDQTERLYIAPMDTPDHLSGPAVQLTAPTGGWDGTLVNEGGPSFEHGGRTWVWFAGNYFYQPDYSAAMLSIPNTGNYLDPTQWTRTGRLFTQVNDGTGNQATNVWAVGSGSLASSPDGTQTWALYGAFNAENSGSDRNVRMQQIRWGADGTPIFGSPTPWGNGPMQMPSGDAWEFEAEDATVTRATTYSSVLASQGKSVGGINYADSAVQFSPWVSQAGRYSIDISYANNSGAPATHELSVNGGAPQAVTYPSTGAWFGPYRTVSIDVTLQQGANTIKFTKGMNYTELDRIRVVARTEAESGNVHHANIISDSAASGGQYVGQIDFPDSSVDFGNVYSYEPGMYRLRVRYSNGTATVSTHTVSVNGVGAGTISYPPTGSWSSFQTATLDVPMPGGFNTVTLAKATGYAALDYLDVDQYQRYYAMHQQVNHVGSPMADYPNAFGPNVVGQIDYADSWVNFNQVYVPSAGNYNVRVHYANGWSATGTHSVSVNGGAATVINYPVTGGWDSFGYATITVPLSAGMNAIKFAKGTNFASLDCVDVTPA